MYDSVSGYEERSSIYQDVVEESKQQRIRLVCIGVYNNFIKMLWKNVHQRIRIVWRNVQQRIRMVWRNLQQRIRVKVKSVREFCKVAEGIFPIGKVVYGQQFLIILVVCFFNFVSRIPLSS